MNIFFVIGVSWKKAILSLKANNSHAWISYIWWLLEPLFLIMTYFLVFGFIFGGSEDYLPNLIIGVVIWTWFANSWLHISLCFVDNRYLMSLINVNKLFYPVSTLFMDMLKQLPVFAVLLCFIIYLGYFPNINWLYLLPLFILQVMLIFSIGFFTCCIVPVYRDLRILLGLVVNLMMFISGVFYVPSEVISDESILNLMYLNPLLILIENYRTVLVEGHPINIDQIIYMVMLQALLLIVSTVIFRKLNYFYIKMH